jgi:hypothetical protein
MKIGFELPIMDKQWSYDSPWDMDAMSNYNTITSLAESPVQEGLIYAGTDDGIIQVTEDGGANWRKIMVDDLPKVPETAFVNDIKADLYDANTVYILLDNHKFGDFDPYIFKSTDKGKSWKSMKGNLPERTLLWRFVQDHVNKDLMFLGTEFGVYFTVNGGEKWAKLTGGVPTISFRDLAIQRRENDLIGATFGRSFYVLDDYSALREVTEEQLNEEAKLFPTRKAWWYKERSTLGGQKGSQGAQYFTAPNPPFGAVFTYYIGKEYKTLKELRKEKEKELTEENKDIPFPGWEKLDQEKLQEESKIILTVRDSDGKVVRKLDGPASKGFHRVSWNLRTPSQRAIRPRTSKPSWEPEGFMVAPGTYTVTLAKQIDGVVTNLSEAMEFDVVRMRKGALEGAEPDQVVAFWEEIEVFTRQNECCFSGNSRDRKKVKCNGAGPFQNRCRSNRNE